MSSSISLAEVLDLPSGPSPQMPAVESRLSANMSNLADAFQTVATPLLSSLPKRIVVDQENGDLYASKSVEVLKKRGWSSFGQEQQKMLADRVTVLEATSPLTLGLKDGIAPQTESLGDNAKLTSLFDQFRAVHFYSRRAQELWSAIEAYELGIETKSDAKVDMAVTSDELDRSVLDCILQDVENASEEDLALINDATREDLKQMRLMLDMTRETSRYLKEAQETYELLQKKVKDEGLTEQTDGLARGNSLSCENVAPLTEQALAPSIVQVRYLLWILTTRVQRAVVWTMSQKSNGGGFGFAN
ncbi:uncharacterized protein STEHIDRAFT_109780 [Stereum hirsutum FP-91666 SS1]|uniref:uncharacterized protein n=1 Tax=Stereum hirsutum (strain FP-91666) TaxID=721885 RepID=UPI000440E169|nr:uncharacterized protein STEHIDRAFT_109780 [Stereum hirsutum FP-91666 SS1]EIM87922.1 hypothetical protein STEHIDRAFT_109780 [Stereum hirsutum FP-91666 SS1]